MVIVAYLLLASALTLLVIFLLLKGKRLKRLTFLGFAFFYFLFFVFSFFNHKISVARINDVNNESAKLETQLNSKDRAPKAIDKTITETPVKNQVKSFKIQEHSDFSGQIGQKLVIKFTLTNNTSKDIDNLTIVFNQSGFSNLLSINAINPNAKIIKNTFNFGKMASGSTQDYTIEVYPKKAGSYESAVSFKNGDLPIKDNNGYEIQDAIKVNIK